MIKQRPFRYEDCPVGADGRRRAMTRGEMSVVLLCNNAPGNQPIKGFFEKNGVTVSWPSNGVSNVPSWCLMPRKRVVWVNHYPYSVQAFETHAAADSYAHHDRVGPAVRYIEVLEDERVS